MIMKKQILYILYSLCGMGILWFCTACTEQDELPAADLQPLAFTIGAPPSLSGNDGRRQRLYTSNSEHGRPARPYPRRGFGNNPVVE